MNIEDANTAQDLWTVMIEHAYAMAVEVAHIQLEALAAEGKTPPLPSKVEDLKGRPEYQSMAWDIIDIDVARHLVNSNSEE